MKRVRLWLLSMICVLLCCGFTPSGCIPPDAFENDGSFWTSSGSDGFTCTPSEEGTLLFATQKAGYGSASCRIEVEPETIYRISFYSVITGMGNVYCIPSGLDGSSSPVSYSQEGESICFYGLTGPGQTDLTLEFYFGSDQQKAEGQAVLSQLSIETTESVPEGAPYVWLYDVGTWEEPGDDMAVDEAENDSSAPANDIGFVPLLLFSFAYLLVIFTLAKNKVFYKKDNSGSGNKIWLILGGSVLLSGALAVLTFGHPTDMVNFSAWSLHAGKVGLADFYTSGMWADYPPGYIYVLYVVGLIGNALNLTVGMPLMNLLIKFPAILADAACGYFIYRMARRYMGERGSLVLTALYVLNPMVIFNSAIWGQMDGVLALLTVLMLDSYLNDRKPLCAVFFVIGVLVKPQMLMFGPVMLVAFIRDIFRSPKKELVATGLSLITGACTLVLLVLPFSLKQDPTWLIEKYTSASVLYPYATVNAYNLFGLLGANWVPDSELVIFGLSYKTVGLILLVSVCVFASAIYLFSKDRRILVPVSALLVWGIYALAHNMHERYLFPAILLLLWAYVIYRKPVLLRASAAATAVTLLNSGMVLLNPTGPVSYLAIALISACNLLGFVYCAYGVIRLCMQVRKGSETDMDGASSIEEIPSVCEFGEDEEDDEVQTDAEWEEIDSAKETLKRWVIDPDVRKAGKMKKKDYLIVLAITVIYGCISLMRLGSTQVPQSYWRERTTENTYVVDLGTTRDLGYLYYYPGIGNGTFEVAFSDDGAVYSDAVTIDTKEENMYTWQRVETPYTGRYLRIKVLHPEIFINEMGIYDEEGKLIPVSCEGEIAKLFDEQDLIDPAPSYMTEMYFDEIYHARTAYEHLLGMRPYENSHPPLGKIFISLGILAFGMNPFGWRIIGALFGIAILPVFYAFAKRLFKKTSFAAFCTALLATDGMLFVQSRIATIDTYGVFFILSMCYYMYLYWESNFYTDGLKKTLLPLGMSGICFGLGIASKWIGFYAGGGLAVAFFITLYRRYKEYRTARYLISMGEGDETCGMIVQSFWDSGLKTLLFCCVFFLLIPAVIYLCSYLPYMLCAEYPYDLRGVMGVQEFMLGYHSQLTATHPYQSPWFTWPLILRPIWFYSGANVPEGMMSSIASFGNPLVWWVSLVFTLYSILSYRRRGEKDKKALSYVFICLGAAFLPWTLITRATFIYHYFASVPFIILLCGFGFRWVEDRFSKPYIKWLFLVMCIGLFVLFYPVWSGLVIDAQWAMQYLRWMPTWWFFSV